MDALIDLNKQIGKVIVNDDKEIRNLKSKIN